MPTYKTDQRRILHRGREFHFVSYDGQPANPRLGQVATEPTWYLMSAGKRWPVALQVANQPDPILEATLHRWLEGHVFSGSPLTTSRSLHPTS